MDYTHYYNEAKRASDLNDEGKPLEAIAIFEALVNSDISDLDKALMCKNIATCCDKMGYEDRAIAWHDEAIHYEEPYSRGLMLEHKAAYLAEKRRDPESIAIYEFLYKQPYTMEADKERIWKNLTILRNPRPA